MSEITKGDMVYVARSHCGHSAQEKYVGTTFITTEFVAYAGLCGGCLHPERGLAAVSPVKSPITGNLIAFPVSWLKKIEPPAQQQTTEQQQELVTH